MTTNGSVSGGGTASSGPDRGAHIVVLGGGYAGVLAAQRLARRGAHLGARVTLVSATDEHVDRIRLHEVAAGSQPRRRPLTRLLRGTGAELRVARVARIDAAHRRLELEGSAGTLAFDFLVLATGSTTDRGAIPGISLHAHTLDGHEGALAVRAAAARGGRLVVCGGGPTAVEAAAELAARLGAGGLRVQLVTRGRLLAGLSDAAAAHARATLARLGAEVLEDCPIAAVEPGVLVTSQGRLGFDACLWAGGFAATPLARASGLPVDDRGRLLVDATLAVPDLPWLLGAGDAARPLAHDGAPLEMSCKCAMPMGATAANNLLARLAGHAPTPLRWGDTGVGVSLGRKDAAIDVRARDGSATGRVVRGRPGAWIKEAVCRFAVGMLSVERLWPGAYRWLPPARQLPAAGADVAS